jgi:hypothetical protein
MDGLPVRLDRLILLIEISSSPLVSIFSLCNPVSKIVNQDEVQTVDTPDPDPQVDPYLRYIETETDAVYLTKQS